MKNLYAMCLAFNDLSFTDGALAQFERQRGSYPVQRKIIIDQHWPLGAQHERSMRLAEIASRHGWEYVDAGRNRNVAGGWAFAMNTLSLGDNDILLGVDPDERPEQSGYLDAIMRVFNADPSIVTVQLNHEIPEYTIFPHETLSIGGETVNYYDRPTAWSFGAFSIAWVKRLGGFLQGRPEYGHIETAMFDKFHPLGGRAVILRDWKNKHIEMQNPQYQQWKQMAGSGATDLDFTRWLEFYS